MHYQMTEHEQRTITTAAAWLSQALGDLRHQTHNTTRLVRLYQGGDLELSEFMEEVRGAYSEIVAKIPTLKRPAAYWFRILERRLSPPVGMDAATAEQFAKIPEGVRSGETPERSSSTKGGAA